MDRFYYSSFIELNTNELILSPLTVPTNDYCNEIQSKSLFSLSLRGKPKEKLLMEHDMNSL